MASINHKKQEDLPMEKDICERIALKRYQLISPVLAEPARAQNEYFRKQAEREHDFPRYGLRKVSVSTMKAWLRMYRKGGFEALKPKSRSDSGRPRRLDQQTLKAVEIPLFTTIPCFDWSKSMGG
jgi:hypothetical protein